jgi:CheY-like chemotaxis protein
VAGLAAFFNMSLKRILVVDDEPDVCRYLAIFFEKTGYVVSCACDGYEAAHLVKQARPDLIMLDPSMPGKTGLKFYREMKSTSELSRIPIVFVAPPAALRGWRGNGLPPPDGQIAKPVDPDEMIGLVNRLIGAREAAEAG